MKKTYYLYLDESGDFDRDLKDRWKNECLVGGYLVEREMDFRETQQILADAYRAVTPEAVGLSNREAVERIAHSTELKNDDHLRKNKAKICYEVLSQLEQKAEFVIFENYNKTKILTSSRTYLNILVDGIMQLLGKLIAQNGGNEVLLKVLAGYRVNTSGEDDVRSQNYYIDPEEYTSRIRERLALERVKRPAVYSSRSQVEFSCGSDKKDHRLVPCDYICNFYITRTAAAFQETREDGRRYVDCLLELYKKENIFHLNGSQEQDRFLNHLQSQTFDAALYDICTGILDEKTYGGPILSHMKQLKEKQVQKILEGLSSYMSIVVDVERNITSSLEYLHRAEDIIQKLSEAGFSVDTYSLDMKLYELAVYDHRGDLVQMNRLFEECRKDLKGIVVHTENINYAYIFFNRYAVYLYDIFEFEKGYELLNQLKKNFEAYELILTDLPGVEIEAEEIRGAQLGKMLGTQVQHCRYMMRQGLVDYEEAISLSDAAIAHFEHESDKRRQYQYRAQIEAEAGNYDEALAYLLRSYGLDRWEDLFQRDNISDFDLYHLSFFMERLSRWEEHQPKIREMVKKWRANERKICSGAGFPNFITYGKIAKTMAHLRLDDALVNKYYQWAFAEEGKPETLPLFTLFMVMMRAEYAGWLLKKGKDPEHEIQEITAHLNAVSGELSLPGIRKICDQMTDTLQTRDAEKYIAFGELLPH